MDRSSLSSLNTARRTAGANDYDRSTYNVGQALVTTCNDPRADAAAGRWPWARVDNSWQLPPPPIDPTKYPNITRADLQRYLNIVSGSFETFLNDRQSLAEVLHQQALLTEDVGAKLTQGDGLAQAAALVPAKYFQEDFSLSRPEIFTSICEVKEDWEVQERIEEVSGYLDVVETQLMREIAGRSQSVFEAAGSLQELHRSLCGTTAHVKGLREQVCEMDEQTFASAINVSRLQKRRQNLMDTLDQMKGMDEVSSSKLAMHCLTENGDYAEALEVLENLKHMVDNQIAVGLQAFRHTPREVAHMIEGMHAHLVAEFLKLANFNDLNLVIERATAELCTPHADHPGGAPALANGGRGNGAASSSSSRWADGSSEAEDAAGRSPGSAPPLMSETAAAREQLHDQLLPLVVGLYRANKLIGIGVLSHLRDNLGSGMKAGIREVVERLLPQLLATLGDAAPPDSENMPLAEKLQMLHHAGFVQLLGVVLRVVEGYVLHVGVLTDVVGDVLTTLKAPPAQVAQMRREMAATVQSMTDVAHGRWIKLLTARVNVHSRLKLYEFQALMATSEAACALAERQGARPAIALRTAISVQCRAYLEHMHSRCMNQLSNMLEAEQWVAMEVPDDFQRIVERLSLGCSSLADGTATTYAPRGSPPRNGTTSGGGAGGHAANGGGRRGADADPAGPPGDGGDPVSPPPARPTHVLQLQGRQYHMVNSSLILIKLLDEYLALNDVVPQFGADIATRTIELIKLFNSQVCHLVLGAGAMKSAGLRSISAKHLALSSQCINVLLALVPLLCGALSALVAQPRRSLLLPEFDRLTQLDLQVHLDEIHSKLVDIMHDRLTATATLLAKEAEFWASGPPGGVAPASNARDHGGAASAAPPAFPPSESIRTLMRQLATLCSVLLPILQREEVYAVFGRVASLYSEVLAGALDALTPHGDVWEAQRRSNTLHLLQCFQGLPMDPSRLHSTMSRLSTFYSKHYGMLPDFASNGGGGGAPAMLAS